MQLKLENHFNIPQLHENLIISAQVPVHLFIICVGTTVPKQSSYHISIAFWLWAPKHHVHDEFVFHGILPTLTESSNCGTAKQKKAHRCIIVLEFLHLLCVNNLQLLDLLVVSGWR